MSREILQNIIEDFSPDMFVRFFREKNRSFAPRKEDLNQYDDENFRNGIKLGEIKFAQDKNPPLPPFDKGGMGGFSDEKMLICAFEATQPLSERSGKKAQYEKGKKILKDTQSDAGIFIFYSNSPLKRGVRGVSSFRFSLIYANYLGKKRDWSVFRRFTYFVSKEYTNKTFLRQIGEEDFSSLEKIKNAFSVEKVTKAFYTDIANWYFWAIQKTEFPMEAEKEENGRNVAVIRLITRLIFIWFMKEKGLIQQDLFNYENISTLLKDLSPKNTQYYKAILQNLFFATLNTKIEDRKFRFGKSFQGKNKDYMDHGIYRYEDYFKNKEDMLEIFKDIPFLNGGLFDCLDRRITENGKNIEIRIDGFTDKEAGLKVPNKLFFSDEINADLNKDYGTKNKKYKVRGLIDILSSYNFTIDENDPNDADVALDPELLGKVFENLLASFNPETATTARKATGSYYTPREIVNYMVDESLTAYLSNVINSETNIRNLISYTDKPHQFTDSEADTLIRSIDNVKILDPAVGSGAFPMGMLHKLVYILGRLDPDNSKWRELQRQKAIKETEEAYKIGDKEERQKRLLDINEVFDDNASDYGRKLYLIENCIYGVDIQPIAVQIAKLRFFISLLVDQNINPKKENLGIRPLPNLETKFVAANTLIGIERPAQGLLRNREIDRKEAELKQVRERHFTARTPKTKQKCIEDDKKLRAEISELLKKDGFPSGITEKLANWNPYDQNASADFFDPEWIFGITTNSPLAKGDTGGCGGFDIVIGNPPYGISLPKELKNFFETFVWRGESYIVFVEKGIQLLNNGGQLSYIVPNTYLNLSFTNELRKYLLKNTIPREIAVLPAKVFDYATVDTTLLFAEKKHGSKTYHETEVKIKQFEKRAAGIDMSNHVCQSSVSTAKWYEHGTFNVTANTAEAELIMRLARDYRTIADIAEMFYGIKVYQVGKGKPPQTVAIRNNKPFTAKTKKDDAFLPFYDGKHIDRYSLAWKENNWLKYGPWLAEPRNPSKFEGEKILIRKIIGQTLIATYIPETSYCNTLLYVLKIKPQVTMNYKYILGILNSHFIGWYFRKKFQIAAEDTFPQIMIGDILQIPIPTPSSTEQKPVLHLVNQILAAKKQHTSQSPLDRGEYPNADTSALEKQIDEMVYKLYGLTPKEIEIVEGKNLVDINNLTKFS